MSEFALIEKYCFNLGAKVEDTVLSVGDDAAIVNVPEGYEMAISMDAMVEGTHYLKGLSPELVAHKILAVNLSDMAAMGAEPKWVTLSHTMPSFDSEWVDKFCTTFGQVAEQYGVEVIGGDTTEGPKVLTVTIMGLLPKGQSMRRSGAKVGDKVYCSGVIGDAALALTQLLGEQEIPEDIFAEILPALHMPQPQVELGKRLLGHVNSCIDLSDGVIGDAVHIAKRSNVTFEIETNKLPLSDAYRRYVDSGGVLHYAVSGGDDYQLMFTAREDKAETLQEISQDLDVKITEIGEITKAGNCSVITLQDGVPTNIKLKPYQHFS